MKKKTHKLKPLQSVDNKKRFDSYKIRSHRHKLSLSQYTVSILSFDLIFVHFSIKDLSWGLSWAIWKFRCLWGQILVLTLRAISKLSYQSPSELFNKAMEYPNKLPFCPWYTVKFVRSIRKELTKISNIKTRHWIPPVPSILALFVLCFRLYSTLAFCCTGRRGKCQLNIIATVILNYY